MGRVAFWMIFGAILYLAVLTHGLHIPHVVSIDAR